MTIRVLNCLESDKSNGQCEPATLCVEVLPDSRIQDAETGWIYRQSTSAETILGWGDLDGESHIVLEGPCHTYSVPSDSIYALQLARDQALMARHQAEAAYKTNPDAQNRTALFEAGRFFDSLNHALNQHENESEAEERVDASRWPEWPRDIRHHE